MFNITQNLIRALASVAVLTALCLGWVTSAFAGPVDLGSAADYAVVAVGGLNAQHKSSFKLYQSGTVINGNVAEGPYTTLDHGIDATVNGRSDYDLTDQNPLVEQPGSNTPSGGFHQLDLSGVALAARNASAAAAALTPTQTFASLNAFDGVGSIVGTSGVNVIRITGDSAVKISLTLSGTATSTFVFQFTSPTTAGDVILSLSGMTMNIGSINPDNIYRDFNGLGGDVSITSMAAGQTVYGNFLAPDRNILSDHGIVDGRLIGGGSGSLLDIHSGSEITVPAPDTGGSTLVLLGIALVGFVGLVRFGRLQVCRTDTKQGLGRG